MQHLHEKLVARMARRWVAGNTLQEALDSAKSANSKGMSAIINYLGEHITVRKEIDAAVNEYLAILERLSALKIDGSISLKLSQIGLDISRDLCMESIKKIVDYASSLNKFVWIDMESSKYLDPTIEIYIEALKSHDNIGLAFQTYIKDGALYLAPLLKYKSKIRLVKGAYNESSDVIFRTKESVDKSYIKMMRLLFMASDNFAIATHDQRMINYALDLNRSYNRRFEFQLLKGIRDDIKSILVSKGFAVSEYIPYGSNITAYSMRRIREHPSNILLLARSLV